MHHFHFPFLLLKTALLFSVKMKIKELILKQEFLLNITILSFIENGIGGKHLEFICNKDKITKIMSEITLALKRLDDLSTKEKKEFLNSPHVVGSAKYNLIVAIEGSIDICNHLISANKLKAPNDYADSFIVLAETGVFEKAFVKRLIEMARFRNRLVHIYWNLDDELIYNIICEDLKDIERFLEIISNLLSNE